MNIIELKALCFSYPSGQQVLNNINLSLNKNEKIGLIGANGAGKSTLLQSLMGIHRASSGTITINNLLLNTKNLKNIRKIMGFVFQDTNAQLFCPTVFEDVAFGPKNLGYNESEVNDLTKKALETVNMASFAQHTPHHLSIGQKRRVSIATVLSMNPEILLLDEPSSNLDPKSARELIKLLQKMEKTLIIATHNLELVKQVCEKTILLHQGQIKLFDNTKTILNNEKLLLEVGL